MRMQLALTYSSTLVILLAIAQPTHITPETGKARLCASMSWEDVTEAESSESDITDTHPRPTCM